MPKRQEPDLALAAAVRRLREERGESLEALAVRAGLTSSSLANIELGKSNPSWPTVKAIAQALNMTPLALVEVIEAA